MTFVLVSVAALLLCLPGCEKDDKRKRKRGKKADRDAPVSERDERRGEPAVDEAAKPTEKPDECAVLLSELNAGAKSVVLLEAAVQASCPGIGAILADRFAASANKTALLSWAQKLGPGAHTETLVLAALQNADTASAALQLAIDWKLEGAHQKLIDGLERRGPAETAAFAQSLAESAEPPIALLLDLFDSKSPSIQLEARAHVLSAITRTNWTQASPDLASRAATAAVKGLTLTHDDQTAVFHARLALMSLGDRAQAALLAAARAEILATPTLSAGVIDAIGDLGGKDCLDLAAQRLAINPHVSGLAVALATHGRGDALLKVHGSLIEAPATKDVSDLLALLADTSTSVAAQRGAVVALYNHAGAADLPDIESALNRRADKADTLSPISMRLRALAARLARAGRPAVLTAAIPTSLPPNAVLVSRIDPKVVRLTDMLATKNLDGMGGLANLQKSETVGLSNKMAVAMAGEGSKFVMGHGSGGMGFKGTGTGGGGLGGYGRIHGLGKIDTGKKGSLGRKRARKAGKIKIGSGTSTGFCKKSDVARVIRRRANSIRACYEQRLQVKPGLKGKVTVRFTIAMNGRVQAASIAQATLNDGAVKSCMLRITRRMAFSKPEGGVCIVQWPFVFAPGGG